MGRDAIAFADARKNDAAKTKANKDGFIVFIGVATKKNWRSMGRRSVE